MIEHPSFPGFWAFCALRTDAWRSREAGGKPPYSDDPFIARHHFCNVYREIDKGTIYFHAARVPIFLGEEKHRRWVKAFPGANVGSANPARFPNAKIAEMDALSTALFQSVAYRLVNRRATFEEWGGIPAPGGMRQWLRHLTERKAGGHAVFTGRHLVRGMRLYALALEHLEDKDRRDNLAFRIVMAETMRDVLRLLKGIPSVGDFFAWQVACDLLEMGAPITAADKDSWALLGPGALMGARLVAYGLPDVPDGVDKAAVSFQSVDPKTALCVARELHAGRGRDEASIAGFTLVPPSCCPGPMSLKNVEHGLCEYMRYVGLVTGRWAGLEVKPWAR